MLEIFARKTQGIDVSVKLRMLLAHHFIGALYSTFFRIPVVS